MMSGGGVVPVTTTFAWKNTTNCGHGAAVGQIGCPSPVTVAVPSAMARYTPWTPTGSMDAPISRSRMPGGVTVTVQCNVLPSLTITSWPMTACRVWPLLACVITSGAGTGGVGDGAVIGDWAA